VQRFLAGFTNAYVVVFTFDGALSLLEEILRLTTGSGALLPLRNAVALSVLAVSVLALFWLPLTPRLPATLLLPLFVAAVWLSYGAAPLPLWLEPPALGLAAAGLQLAAAGFAFAWLRRSPHAPHGWWDPGPELPLFSLRHGLRVWAVLVLGLLPAAVVYGAVLLVTTIEVGTRRFVAFDREGITLADRSYHRGDREIRLVGMMHVGEGEAYREVVESFRTPATVVLEEGVTDDTRVLAAPLSYDGVAGVLGLEAQAGLASYLEDPETRAMPEWPVLRHADVDLAAFDARTIAWLEDAQALWSGEGGGFEVLRDLVRMSSEEPAVVNAVQHDLFELRNEHLLGEIRTALGEFDRVVVPWGALHLPAIEAAILDDGFEPGASQRRRLVSWRTVLEALAEPQEMPAGPSTEPREAPAEPSTEPREAPAGMGETAAAPPPTPVAP